MKAVKLCWVHQWTDEDQAIIGDASSLRMHAICDEWQEYAYPAKTVNEVMNQINTVHTLSQEMEYDKVY